MEKLTFGHFEIIIGKENGQREGKYMGKVDENKQQKEDALFRSAYNLFMSNGISKTSIHDIVQDAGVAKGTFYLYFKDKFEIRDRLIARTAEKLFKAANTELKKVNVPKFEDKIIFIVDYVLEQMKKNKAVLRFVSKNLSWGIFRAAIEQKEEATGVKHLFDELLAECPGVQIEAPDTMLFLIIELASSTSYSTILDSDPVSYEELKPYLNASIRAIIKSHMYTTQRHEEQKI